MLCLTPLAIWDDCILPNALNSFIKLYLELEYTIFACNSQGMHVGISPVKPDTDSTCKMYTICVSAFYEKGDATADAISLLIPS